MHVEAFSVVGGCCSFFQACSFFRFDLPFCFLQSRLLSQQSLGPQHSQLSDICFWEQSGCPVSGLFDLFIDD